MPIRFEVYRTVVTSSMSLSSGPHTSNQIELDSQSAVSGARDGARVGVLSPLSRTCHTPPSLLHHLKSPKSTSVVTCATKRLFAQLEFRKRSSPRKRQLTVHLKRNTLENSYEFLRYDQGYCSKKGAPMSSWVPPRASIWRTVERRPRRRKRITRSPGTYSSTDIFTDSAQLHTGNAHKQRAHNMKPDTRTQAALFPVHPSRSQTQRWQLVQLRRPSSH